MFSWVRFLSEVKVMSRTIELPDSVYAALREEAEASGMTLAAWIASRLPDASARMEGRDEAPRTLAERFAGRFGQVASGGRERLSEEGGRKFTDGLEGKRRAGHL
jgi:hypothetical protein